ncbi:MAG: hypothetical protein KC636_35330 [Myxococcales bacterium]|nr:hypothetical protein [Myxococcales bacterium]
MRAGTHAPREQALRSDRRATLVVAALALALLAALLVHGRAWAFLCDDAYISFRYAENLAERGSLEFNPGLTPPERVEGYSNLLWVLLLAGGQRLGLSPPTLAPWLTTASSLAGLALVTLLVRALRQRFGASPRWSPLDLSAALWLAALPEYAVWSQGGLETSFALAWALAATLAWTRDRPIVAAAAAALAGLTRQDSLLPIAGFGLVWILVLGTPFIRAQGPRRALQAIPWRRLAVALAVFIAPLLAQLLWRRHYYGAWLPNTWAIKAYGALLRDSHGLPYLAAWVAGLGGAWLWALAPLAALVRARHLLLVAPAALVLAYAWSVGGDFMAYSRFLLVATTLTAALVGWLARDAYDLLRVKTSGWRRVAASLLVTLAVAALVAGTARRARARWRVDMATTEGWLDGRYEGARAMDRFARIRVHAGAWMRENLPQETWITVGAAGALPYASGLRIIDAYGLVDPVVATTTKPHVGPRARPGHQLHASRAYLLSRDPDLLCHVGIVGRRRPGPADATRRGFRTGYAWACVDPGPASDPREPGGAFDPGYYCCLRPRGREVGPFR